MRGRQRKIVGRLILVCLAVTGAALIFSYYFNVKLEPLIVEMGTAKVDYAAKAAMNDAITKLIDDGAVDYSAIISFEKDDVGAITAVRTNMAQINRLKAKLTDAILDSILNISIEDLSVPVGNLSAMDYLSGKGPGIPVKIIAVRTVSADFKNGFDTAGINQTIHRIYILPDIEITILTAGHTEKVEVRSEFCISETVIVGSVPGSYTYFSGTDTAAQAAENYFNLN